MVEGVAERREVTDSLRDFERSLVADDDAALSGAINELLGGIYDKNLPLVVSMPRGTAVVESIDLERWEESALLTRPTTLILDDKDSMFEAVAVPLQLATRVTIVDRYACREPQRSGLEALLRNLGGESEYREWAVAAGAAAGRGKLERVAPLQPGSRKKWEAGWVSVKDDYTRTKDMVDATSARCEIEIRGPFHEHFHQRYFVCEATSGLKWVLMFDPGLSGFAPGGGGRNSTRVVSLVEREEGERVRRAVGRLGRYVPPSTFPPSMFQSP